MNHRGTEDTEGRKARKELTGVSGIRMESVLADPLETKIATELWRWAFLSDEERARWAANAREFEECLEFYLCSLFETVEFTRSRGIWCDGVMNLVMTRPSRLSFLIAGAAWAPNEVRPFELEFYFSKRRSLTPIRTVLRFGFGNSTGSGRHRRCLDAEGIVANRPRRNPDWAVAVELRPLD